MVGIKGVQVSTRHGELNNGLGAIKKTQRDDFAARAPGHAPRPQLISQQHFRSLDALIVDTSVDATAFEPHKQGHKTTNLVQVLETPKDPSPMHVIRRKVSDWRLKKKEVTAEASERPESFRCHTAAALEEAFLWDRDRYQAALANPHGYAEQHHVSAMATMATSPLSQPLRQRAEAQRENRALQRQSELAYLQRLPQQSAYPRAIRKEREAVPPVPPLPEKYRQHNKAETV